MPTGREAAPLMSAGLPTQYVDIDPDETAEWRDSFDAVLDRSGAYRARYLMLQLLERAAERSVGIPSLRSTDYINTIPPEREPWFPGDEAVERRIRAFIRWNAAVMVHRAQRFGVGGHISTFASSASLYEVGFNHFFRGHDAPGGADQVFIQGHASPGIYARAFLEGRLTEAQLDGFRRELSHRGGGLPSYPHPRLMPWFWQFPTVSMGLGPLNAVYQARLNRYLTARGIADARDRRVWAFIGDGEMDEPESVAGLTLAAREHLDNLTFVINANLQRLDGPVRGNGKVIQELESLFRGAGWNVIKVVWGRKWDQLLARDADGALVNLMNTTPDGDFQTYKAESGAYIREHFFGRDARTARMVADWTDEEIWSLQRGGHDYRKLYAAYDAAVRHVGQPTVIIAKTVKGWTLGSHFEGRNATHQMKKLSPEDLRVFRDRLQIPVSDAALAEGPPPYYHPGASDPVVAYLHDRRRQLGGYLPERRVRNAPLSQPVERTYAEARAGYGTHEVATTMAFVRLLKDLLKDPGIGRRIVPIIPDEARTFGMDSLFPSARIYNPLGQQYTAVDRDLLLSYRESTEGQILHEGINEAGSVASWTAAGTSYATHGEPLIPVYIFYSMFGFQRTGDAFWAAMDQMARGFVIGATAGRTTLTGEGLQHADGHSLLLAASNPAARAWDPAYAYEVAHIVRHGLAEMFGPDPVDVFYYLTVYNEPYRQPAEPADLDVGHLVRGAYRLTAPDGARARILASGIAVRSALRAAELLASEWQTPVEVWSVTSWGELAREAIECDRWNLLNPGSQPRVPFVSTLLTSPPGPTVAVSDWMRAVPDLIRPWVPGDYIALGTDGWGVSDTRGAARRHFLVDAESTAVQVLESLAARGEMPRERVQEAFERYRIDDPAAADAGSLAGDA